MMIRRTIALRAVALLLMAVVFLFSSCSGGGDDLADALGSGISGIEAPTDNGNSQNVGAESGVDNLSGVDYSAFSSILHGYRKMLYPMRSFDDEMQGELYADLIDFNQDGVYELVIARFLNAGTHETDNRLVVGDDSFIGGSLNPSVQVYSLDENATAKNVGEFAFITYSEEGYRFNVEIAEVSGKTYLVEGGDVYDYGISGDLVDTKLFYEFDGDSFHLANSFNVVYTYGEDGYEPSEFYHDGELITYEEFEPAFVSWTQMITSYTVIGVGFESNYQQVTQETIDFLESYPRKNSVGESAIFSDGYFAIYETEAQDGYGQAVTDYLNAMTLADYESAGQIMNNNVVVDLLVDSRQNGNSLPGMIVENIATYHPQEYSGLSINLWQEISSGTFFNNPFEGDLNDTLIVQVDLQEIIDMETVQYAGQYGSDVTYWYMFENTAEGEPLRLIGVYDDYNHGMLGSDTVLQAAYLLDYDTIFDSYGYEFPIGVFEQYLTTDEIGKVEYYGTDNEESMFLIKSERGTPIYVYENTVGANGDNVRGDLLMQTGENILYLGCGFVDNVADVEIVTIPFEGFEVSYYPTLLDEEEQNMQPYVENMPWL